MREPKSLENAKRASKEDEQTYRKIFFDNSLSKEEANEQIKILNLKLEKEGVPFGHLFAPRIKETY